MSESTHVTTINGNRYTLGGKLGQGGEGAVFPVQENHRIAVKLLRIRSAQAREGLRDQLAMVGRLPLENLAVARPIEQLRPPHVGYVMELFTDMVPIQSLVQPPPNAQAVKEWYFSGGGLLRRLRLLARVAEILSQLHGRGLVYADPSPQNIFVSKHAEACEVRLIDMDNLRPATSVGRSIYTPEYGAPEVVRQVGISNSLSDAHAFTVIAFRTLALVHPLMGDLVTDGEPEMEECALSGQLPWIDAPEDDSNRSSHGIPRSLVLSRLLREDFNRAFGPGLSDPVARPGLARWAARFHRAADFTVICPACSGSYYCSCKICPWPGCGEVRPACIFAEVYLWDPKKRHKKGNGQLDVRPGILRGPNDKPRRVDEFVLSANQTMELTERITHGTAQSVPKLRIEFKNERLILTRLDETCWYLSSDKQYKWSAEKTVTLEMSAGVHIHAGSKDQLHRRIRFSLVKGNSQ